MNAPAHLDATAVNTRSRGVFDACVVPVGRRSDEIFHHDEGLTRVLVDYLH